MPSLNDVRLWHGAIFVKRGPFEGGVLRFRFQLPAECAGGPRWCSHGCHTAYSLLSRRAASYQLPDAGRFPPHHLHQPGVPPLRRPQGSCPPWRRQQTGAGNAENARGSRVLLPHGPVHRRASWTSPLQTRTPWPVWCPRCGTCGRPFTTARGGLDPMCATGPRRNCASVTPPLPSLPPYLTCTLPGTARRRLDENEAAFMERASGCALLSRKKVYENEEGSTLRFSRPTAQHDLVRRLVFGGVIVRAACARSATMRSALMTRPLPHRCRAPQHEATGRRLDEVSRRELPQARSGSEAIAQRAAGGAGAAATPSPSAVPASAVARATAEERAGPSAAQRNLVESLDAARS